MIALVDIGVGVLILAVAFLIFGAALKLVKENSKGQ